MPPSNQETIRRRSCSFAAGCADQQQVMLRELESIRIPGHRNASGHQAAAERIAAWLSQPSAADTQPQD